MEDTPGRNEDGFAEVERGVEPPSGPSPATGEGRATYLHTRPLSGALAATQPHPLQNHNAPDRLRAGPRPHRGEVQHLPRPDDALQRPLRRGQGRVHLRHPLQRRRVRAEEPLTLPLEARQLRLRPRPVQEPPLPAVGTWGVRVRCPEPGPGY